MEFLIFVYDCLQAGGRAAPRGRDEDLRLLRGEAEETLLVQEHPVAEPIATFLFVNRFTKQNVLDI